MIATMRLYLYNLTVAGLQIFLNIATRLELFFMELVGKTATWGVLHHLILINAQRGVGYECEFIGTHHRFF